VESTQRCAVLSQQSAIDNRRIDANPRRIQGQFSPFRVDWLAQRLFLTRKCLILNMGVMRLSGVTK
jgi:hypothetical protein